MTARVFCGTFEAEAHWREPNLARLPSLTDRNESQVIAAMDEMLFALCDPGDRLVTARSMHEAHAEYLQAIGFSFQRNDFDLVASADEDSSAAGAALAPNIFRRMCDERVHERLAALLPIGARLEPFAVLPGAREAAQRYGLNAAFPPAEVIRRVNTKSYAVEMRERLEIPNPGVVVSSHQSLSDVGAKLLGDGPFLIKDEYGVSGRGNQLVETESILRRIVQYIAAQVPAGKRVRFVLEPYLAKHSDFSCQFRVEQDGRITLISVQELLNRGLAFGASCSISSELRETLERARYFDLIERMGSLMRTDGYYGDVCVDSMVLLGGELAPLVEINARKSMSLIKHAMDRYLATRDRKGCLTYVSTMAHTNSDFRAVLGLLDQQDLLFTVNHQSGILPLTSRTMRDCGRPTNSPVRGKLYLVAICDTPEEQPSMMSGLARALNSSGVRVVQ